MILFLSIAWAQDETPAPAPSADGTSTVQRSNRMEFDERLVKGESASGSVYLFKRQPRALPGLVPMRRSYLARIVVPVLGPDALEANKPEEGEAPEPVPEMLEAQPVEEGDETGKKKGSSGK